MEVKEKSTTTSAPIPNGNREYQDSVFRLLFSDKESALELYNAIEGTNYGPETEVKFTTLKDVLYVNGKNDLSFEIAGKFVVLTEHQSTVNYNMPMRHLEYITQVFKEALQNEDLFKRNRIPILAPEFYVIYTGEEDWKESELRLSDSYTADPPENSMELVVKTIDVRYNKENAKAILARSEKLRGYSLLLNYIKGYGREGYNLRQAIDLAVNQCIEENVLREFLTKYGKELKGMLYHNITLERFAEIRAEEAREEAHKMGHAEGYAEGYAEGENRMGRLFKALKETGRLNEFERASDDADYRKTLFEEFAI